MESVVLFGSQVSGGVDSKSDQDLLVICEPNEKKKNIQCYSKQGYSVSSYSEKQLYYMKMHGSLFLQHLKTESKILFDKNDLFANFMTNCALIPASAIEMTACFNSLRNAMQCPRGQQLSWWQADYLYVLSRDYFVKYFSQTGKLQFNAKKLCRAIQQEFNLNHSEASVFLELRQAKAIYRSSSVKIGSVTSIVDKWNMVLSKILGCSLPQYHSNETYLNARDPQEFESTYELLRYIESLKIAFPNVGLGEEKDTLIHKLIISPNHYSSTSTRGKEFLINYLVNFRVRANKANSLGQQKAAPLVPRYAVFGCR